ncbi:MAG: RagB/SusD family nutrient uptake outer membrane protein [Bacteroidota bacterium]
MKLTRINIYLVLAAMVAFTACDSRLNVEPQQSIDETQALSTPGNVLAALTGAYDGLSDNDVWGGSQHLSDLLADDNAVIWAGTFEEPEEIFQKSILVQNGDVERFWTESYEAINRANNVLSAISILDAGDQARVEAEARFIRAACYFDLVNMFGKVWNDGDPNTNLGVPLVLEPTRAIDESSEIARNTVAGIYAQILADLTFAKENLPDENGGFATTYAASGLLSRMHLMQANFTEAAAEAERVINSGLFSLVDDYSQAFTQSANTTEDIFAIEVTSQDGANDYITFYAAPEFGGRGDIDVTADHLTEYEAGDERLNLFYVDALGIDRTGKWVDNASQDGNINIMRLAEMYLTLAEAKFRTGDAAAAATNINIVRDRVGLAAIAEADLTLENILTERRLELMFEGHLFRDRKRTEDTIGSLAFSADELVYPIPQRERDVNANLVQNAGYPDN